MKIFWLNPETGQVAASVDSDQVESTKRLAAAGLTASVLQGDPTPGVGIVSVWGSFEVPNLGLTAGDIRSNFV